MAGGRRAGRRRVVAAKFAAAAAIAAVVVSCSEAAPQAFRSTANRFVSSSGSDSGSCTQAAPCASFNRAYQLARPGETVEVAAGSYEQQTLMQSQPAKASPAVLFRSAAGARVVVRGLQLGVNNGQASGSAPSYLTLDGFEVNGQFHASFSGIGAPPTNIVLRNSHVYGWDQPGPLLLLRDLVNSSFVNVEVGPGCCQADAIELAVRNQGDPSPQNIVFDRLYVHDVADTCRSLPSNGDCVGTGFGDGCGSCDHIDGIQAYGGLGLTITNSRFYNAGTQNIFFQSANGGLFSNILIENTMVSTSLGAVTNSVSLGGPGTSVFSGYARFRYNSFQKDVRIYQNVLAPGTQVEFTGNIANYRGDNGGTEPCAYAAGDGSTITPSYSHNLFARKTCGQSDLLGAPSYVSSSAAAPDLHLERGSRGIGRADIASRPTRDLDGDIRPTRRAPDIGADQRETASIVTGHSIGRLRLGAPRTEVVEFFGRPRSVKHFVSTRGPVNIASYAVHGGNLSAWYSGDKVVGMSTTTSYYSTAAGTGVGADTDEVRKGLPLKWVDCRHAYRRRSGSTILYFTPTGGKEHGRRVQSVLMTFPGFDLPKVDAKASKGKSRETTDCRPKLR